MFERIRALISGSNGITSINQGDSKKLTATDVLASLQNIPSGNALATLLLDNNSDVGALRYAPILAAERFITESIAALPLIVYDDQKERAVTHSAYQLLKRTPNNYQTPFLFFKSWLQCAVRFGNGFVLIERNGAGEAANLILLDNRFVKVEFIDGEKFYDYSSPALSGKIADSDMLHLMGFTNDGVAGVPIMHYCTEVIKLGLAVERYALRFFAQGTASRGHIEMPPGTTQSQYDQIVESWTAAYTGSDNQWKTPILAYGAKWVDDSPPNDDAQLLELRKFQILEAARVMRVPPHVIQHFETGGTYANIEAQSIDLVQNSLQHWIVQIEQQINSKLFPNGEYCAEFLIDARLRGSTLDRFNAYKVGREGGWLSINDIRRSENLPDIDNGDDYLATPPGAGPNPSLPPADPAPVEAVRETPKKTAKRKTKKEQTNG